MSLLITKAKPNPAGKDRVGRTLTPQTQLAAEWVDIKNTTSSPVNMNGVELYHYAYLGSGAGEWQLVTEFNGTLPSGQTVRVHSGNQILLTQMNLEDQNGAEYHVFSHKNYVWNNANQDFPGLWYKPSKQWIDKTEYDTFPVEGKILTRVNQKLI